jgi:outer membrane protein assembly factor BamB
MNQTLTEILKDMGYNLTLVTNGSSYGVDYIVSQTNINDGTVVFNLITHIKSDYKFIEQLARYYNASIIPQKGVIFLSAENNSIPACIDRFNKHISKLKLLEKQWEFEASLNG